MRKLKNIVELFSHILLESKMLGSPKGKKRRVGRPCKGTYKQKKTSL